MYTSGIVFMQTPYQTDIRGLYVSRTSIKASRDTKCISLHMSVTLHTTARAHTSLILCECCCVKIFFPPQKLLAVCLCTDKNIHRHKLCSAQ